jgi:hypothetical protein
MVEQGKRMRVGAGTGYAYNSVNLVLLANGTRYDVDSNTFFLGGKPTIHLKYCPVPTMKFFFLFCFRRAYL